MPVLYILAIVAVACVIAFVLIKVIDRTVNWALERENQRTFDRITIGSRWSRDDGDPWGHPIRMTVLDKQDGWIRYIYDGSDRWWTSKARMIASENWVELTEENENGSSDL